MHRAKSSVRCVARTALLLCLVLGSVQSLAAGLDEELEFDLPGGPLGETLLAVARQAGTVISFQPGLVEAQVAPAIRGRLTLMQALTLATQKTSLAVEWTPAGALTLRPAPPPAVATPAVPVPGVAGAAPEPAAVVALPPVEVLGSSRRDDGLRAVRSGSATRDNTPLGDLPQSVSVLTAEALDLQGGASTTDALRYVNGLSTVINFLGTGGLILQSAQVRGLPALFALSGMRTIRNDFPADLAFISRIEVPKGPSAVIGGAADFGGRGGTVNFVRKQAEPGHRNELTQTLGTQDDGSVRLMADLGGTLPGDTLWRLVGLGGGTGRTEGGYTHQGSAGMLGSLAWRHEDFRVAFTLQAEARRSVPAPSARGGLDFDGERLVNRPLEPGIIPPLNPGDRILTQTTDVEMDLEWRIARHWRLGWKARVEDLHTDMRRFQRFTRPLLLSADAEGAGSQWSLATDFSTGPVQHRVMAGLDTDLLQQETRIIDFANDGTPLPARTVEGRELRLGVLLQDQMRLGPWRVRLGLQRTRLPQYRADGQVDLSASRLLATNWDAGALVRLSHAVSVYAGSQYTVESNPAQLTADGLTAPPTTLRQAQAGLKLDLLDGQMDLSIEAFRIRQALLFSEQVGFIGRSADGVELELAGRPWPVMDLSLGLTLQRPSARQLVLAADGRPVLRDGLAPEVPRRALQMLARLRLPERWAPRTSLGAGLRAASSTFVIPLNPFQPREDFVLPGGGQLDLSLEHRFGAWSVRALVGNVFDRQLYANSTDTAYLPLHPGRNLAITAAYREP